MYMYHVYMRLCLTRIDFNFVFIVFKYRFAVIPNQIMFIHKKKINMYSLLMYICFKLYLDLTLKSITLNNILFINFY